MSALAVIPASVPPEGLNLRIRFLDFIKADSSAIAQVLAVKREALRRGLTLVDWTDPATRDYHMQITRSSK